MKAIRVENFGDPDVMKLTEVPTPTPQAGQALVRIHAAGLNPYDTYIRSGQYARLPHLPYTPGGDGAGIVAVLGEGVTRFKVGDRVWIGGLGGDMNGTYAEYANAPEGNLGHLPDALSYEQGAAIWVPYSTAYRAIYQRANVRAAETVFINGGSGGVGTACIQLLKAIGTRIAATAGTDERCDHLRRLGVELAINYKTQDYVDLVKQWTSGKGVNVVLEMVAGKNLGRSLQVLTTGGRLVIIGSRSPTEINPRDIMSRETTVTGVMLFNATGQEMQQLYAGLEAGMTNGTISPIVGTSLPLAEAPQAHRMVGASSIFGNLVLTT
ncbi:MAG: NADPH:quinone reductase [Chloroflexi bacterium]|nr:NADPH:quinone reductase [Chloroflexota bacterium]